MSESLIAKVQKSQIKTDIPRIDIGDTVDVHVKIIEGSKERIQVFSGVVIKQQNSGLEHTITVRRIVANQGVERTFPVHSPRIAKMQVKRSGHVRRSKLYYLRDRVGKKRRLQDKRRGIGKVGGQGESAMEQSATAAQSSDEAQAKEHEQQPVQEIAGRKE